MLNATNLTDARAHRVMFTIFLVIIGAYSLVATVTYTPFDPGWTHLSSDTQHVSNATGIAGAWLADLLHGFLGRAAVFLPFLILSEAVQIWYPHSFVQRPFRYAGELFLLVIISTLFGLHGVEPSDTLQNAAGGILGFEMAQHLLGFMPLMLVTALLVILFLVIFKRFMRLVRFHSC
jgi:S-DNA-T family DNA segregation ATPase FtsK/SpoIIIE